MIPEQISFFQTAVAQMRTASIVAPQPHDADSLTDFLRKQGIRNASVSFSDLSATGFSDAGTAAIGELAKSFRPSLSAQSKAASNATLGKFIAGEIISHWKGRAAASLGSADFDRLGKAIEDWFTAQNAVRRHIVPCTLFPYPLAGFTIGPVAFCPLQDFPCEEFGVPRAEFWPPAPPRWKQWLRNVWAAICGRPVDAAKPGGFQLESLIEFAARREAPWVALVDVSGRAPSESTQAADLATDVALAALQIVSPGDDMRRLARATGRAAPIWRVDVSQVAAGGLSVSSGNRMPALARSPDLIENHLAGLKPVFESFGRRIEGYVAAGSPLPELNSAWCNGAYWYHEALAETLDTVAVAKLETAIEVLFRAASMSRSKQRLLDSFDAMFGLGPKDFVNGAKTVTVDQFVFAITTARSRILHGTWPTLHNDLPSQPGRLTTSYRDVEQLTRTLLLTYSIQLDSYQSDGQTDDTTEAFIAWIKAERLRAPAVGAKVP